MTDEMKNIKMQETMGKKKVSKRTVATIKAYLFFLFYSFLRRW